MDKFDNTSKAIAVAAIIVIVVLLVFIYGSRGSQAPATQTTSTSSTQNSGAAGTATATTTSASTGGVTSQPSSGSKSAGTNRPPVVPPPIIIRFITPVANDQWKIGVTNPITWNNGGNITGEIDLLDGNGAFVGVILSQTGPQQTSYGWDTREYFLSRYSPLKKEMVPGTYEIRLEFDGNNLPPIISPKVTITN